MWAAAWSDRGGRICASTFRTLRIQKTLSFTVDCGESITKLLPINVFYTDDTNRSIKYGDDWSDFGTGALCTPWPAERAPELEAPAAG